MNNLKNCPFCGSKYLNKYTEEIKEYVIKHIISCSECGGNISRINKGYDETIKAWNTRLSTN